jgi:dehydrogenase/reductase SDR family protein 12
MSYSQFAASSQFYLYGKKHFNQTGYLKHIKDYKPAPCMESDLTGKVFMVTGANSGIGKEISSFLAKRKAAVYMLCRTVDRAEKVRNDIREESKNDNVHVLQVDCSLESSVRACWKAFVDLHGEAPVKLDGLVCNAGMLLNEKQRTSEGVEVTFACHLLFGCYLLGALAMPSISATRGRIVLVASGGMYNTKFPDWEVATSLKGNYNGNLVYAYAKRGQVLLAERWATEFPAVKVVAAHPGWTLTDAVDAAYGDQKKYLEPMRTPWQGAEGICWLLVAPLNEIEPGAFYLDRKPQVKHMAGPFFSEGSFTKNSPAEVDAMMANLENWTSTKRPSKEQLQAFDEVKATTVGSVKGGLKPMEGKMDVPRFMGKWYVIAHIPTFLDRGTVNNTEEYQYDAQKNTVDVTFTYTNAERTKTSQVKQLGLPNEVGTEWKLKIPYVPVKMPYMIADCSEDYSRCLVSEPGRSFLYFMARTPAIPEEELNDWQIKAMKLGFDSDKIMKVPQAWDAEGQEKK